MIKFFFLLVMICKGVYEGLFVIEKMLRNFIGEVYVFYIYFWNICIENSDSCIRLDVEFLLVIFFRM